MKSDDKKSNQQLLITDNGQAKSQQAKTTFDNDQDLHKQLSDEMNLDQQVLGKGTIFHIFAKNTELDADTNGNFATDKLIDNPDFGSRGNTPNRTTKDIYYIGNAEKLAPNGFRTGNNYVILGNDANVKFNGDQVYVNGTRLDHVKKADVKIAKGYLDIDSELQKLSDTADYLAGQSESANVKKDFTDMNNQVIDVSAAQDDLIIINIDSQKLSNPQPITIKGLSSKTAGQAVILNVKGDQDISWQTQIKLIYDDGTQLSPNESHSKPNHVLWNFGNAKRTVNINSGYLMGSVLVPNGTINVNVNADGNLVAHDVNIRGGESHRWDLWAPSFSLPTPVTPHADHGQPEKPQESTDKPKPSKSGQPTNPEGSDKPATPEKPSKTTTPDKPSKSTTPDKPSKTTTPDKPSKPTTPDKPSKTTTPEKPEQPATPDTPSQPEKPQESTDKPKPSNPGQPTKPEEPVTPTTPDKPSKTTTPEKPEQPATPDTPSQPEKPQESTDKPKPSNTGQPTNPEEPVTPTTPTTPDTPETPDIPSQPDEPENPTPGQPGTPDQPENPDTPDQPEKPQDSTDKSKPSKPDQPTNPEEPVTPTTPDKPTTPDTPDQPVNPDVPSQPDEPTTPVFPHDGGYVQIPGHEDHPTEPTTPTTPDTPQPEVPETPDTPDTPGQPEVPNTPETPTTPNTPDTPSQPEVPDTPETPKPDTPGTPNQPEVPDTPKTPTPDTPDTDQPEVPTTPVVPQEQVTPTPDEQTTPTPADGEVTTGVNQLTKEQSSLTSVALQQSAKHEAASLPQTGNRGSQLSFLAALTLGLSGLLSLIGLKKKQ